MSAREQAVVESVPTGLFIGGQWREATGGARLEVEDPSTGAVLTTVADATVEDGAAALDAAVAAQGSWAATPPRDRGEILRAAFEKIVERKDDIALLMTLEMGKPIKESLAEIAYGAEFFRWFAEESVRIAGRWQVAPNGATRLLTMKQPVGPCLMITPWNFPLAMGTRKIGPAIAAGCTMVVKPASQTPLTMLALAQILAECGLPDGVLNVVTTTSTGKVMEPLIRDPRLRKLTFTGSTPVGRSLVEQSAQGLLRVSMELGGNAPFLVFDDADLDQAVDGAMVVKPASQTPLTMLALAQILAECGLPDGVLNVVTTTSTGKVMEPLIRDPRLRKLTFTGSTPVGRSLVEQSAQGLLRVSMELGGNAPFLVFDDADLDKAVDGAMLAKMRNIGEACTAANRFLVHESVAAEFSARLTDRMAALKIGRGTEDGVDVGPLIDAKQRDKVAELVQDAVDHGAKVLTGGSALGGIGYYYPPTVLSEVPTAARIFAEEVFGPVAPITTFSTDDEAVALANDTEFGLVAYAFTQGLTRAMTVAERLETGMVGINQGIVSNPAAPFGGVKASGFGREGGVEGINEYLETKYVGLAL